MSGDEWIRSRLVYSPDTGVFRRKRKHVEGGIAGSLDKDGYRIISLRGRRFRAGRLAWWFVHGEWPACEIDHINQDRADDRICNLRPVSKQFNRLNKRHRNKKSGFPFGVSYKNDSPRAKPWVAHIMIDGKLKVLGHFHTADEASVAYEAARNRLLEEISNAA